MQAQATPPPTPFDQRFPQILDCESIFRAGLRSLRPPDRITVSEWADKYRILDSRSPEPGPWRTSRVPYMKEIMDRISVLDPCQTVVMCKSAQVAGTEMIHNALGYLITEAPGPTLVVAATVDMAKDWSKDRFQGLVDTTPRLRERIGIGEWKEKDGDNTLRYKRFPGGSLFVAGANSPSGLRSKPIRYLFLDEVDSYPHSAGKEGDPVQLAVRRTSNFTNRKIVMVSTPTIKGESRIQKAYEDSDQRRYFVPCLTCGHMQTLKWENVTWSHTGNPKDAVYSCEKNGCVIEEYQRPEMLARGEWRAERPGAGDGVTYGYHISSLYSPWRKWAELAYEFTKAKPPGKPPNLHLLQVFVNTVLGEVWDDTGGREVSAVEMMAKRNAWWKGPEMVVPREATILTAGVDVQDDRLEVLVWAWGPGKEGWLIDQVKIYQIPSQPECWDDLASVLDRTYAHESGVHLSIGASCIDTGGHFTDEVLDFAHLHRSRRRFATKGVAGMNKPIWTGKFLAGTKRHRRRNCFPVGVDGAKSWLYACLNSEQERLHFPDTSKLPIDFCDATFFEQLCVEKRRPKYLNGRQIWFWWKPDHVANEALDCTVYALAALEALLVSGKKLDRIPEGVAPRAPDPPADPKPRPKLSASTSGAIAPAAAQSPVKRPPATAGKAPPRRFLPAVHNWLRR